MHRLVSSHRRRLAVAGSLVVLATVTVAALLVIAGDGTGAVERRADAHAALDDRAAAAEVQFVVASLRSGIDGRSANRNGTHARRFADQLDDTFNDARLQRSESWAPLAAAVARLREQLAAADPGAAATIVELEDSLRALAR